MEIGKEPAAKHSSLQQFDFEGFGKHLTSLAGGSIPANQAKKMESDIHKFFGSQARSSTARDSDLLLDLNKVSSWLDKEQVKAFLSQYNLE